MLVLTRKPCQRILIGDTITLTVTRVSGNRVSLGIEAPEEVTILRGELEPRFAAEAESEAADAVCEPIGEVVRR